MDTARIRGMTLGLVLGLVAAIGCGGADGGTADASMNGDAASQDGSADDARHDARSSSDAGDGNLDACDTCGVGTICVACNCGGATTYACEPVPEGCEAQADRNCSCPGVAAFCTGDRQGVCQNIGGNAILCETGMD